MMTIFFVSLLTYALVLLWLKTTSDALPPTVIVLPVKGPPTGETVPGELVLGTYTVLPFELTPGRPGLVPTITIKSCEKLVSDIASRKPVNGGAVRPSVT